MKQVLKSVITALSLLISVNTHAQNINQPIMEQVHKKKESTNEKYCVIDKITIPVNAIAAYTEKAEYIRHVLRQQAGLLKYETFQLKDDNGNLKIITVATWANLESLDKARLVIREAMKNGGINMPSFLEQNGIIMERDIYIPVEE
jgi:hypothetical protein